MGPVGARGHPGPEPAKKKDLTSEREAAPGKGPERQAERPSPFRSAFEQSRSPVKAEAMFLPPEAFGHSLSADEEEAAIDLASASSWDIAIRYHEFKARPSMSHLARKLRKVSAQAVLERAQAVLGSVVHPMETHVSSWDRLPAEALHPDLDLEETVDQSPLVGAKDAPLAGQDVWMSFQVPRRQSLVLTVDTSLSMTGEKLALTAVALAVVLLQFPDDPVGIVAFENEARVIKRPDERISVDQLVERFLDVPAQGYTHLEDGMRAALRLSRSLVGQGRGRLPSTVLLTDGKYTAGRDPAYLAARFSHLVVMKMGSERASLELCRELARKGRGGLREVAELSQLPAAMYGIVKDLLRGSGYR